MVDMTKQLRENRRRQKYENDGEESEFVDVLSPKYKAAQSKAKTVSAIDGESLNMMSAASNQQRTAARTTTTAAAMVRPFDQKQYEQNITHANKLIDQEQFFQAQKLLTECIEMRKQLTTNSDAYVFAQRSKCYTSKGELDLAMKDLDSAISILQNSSSDTFEKVMLFSECSYNRAVIHFNCFRMMKSVEDYNVCIDILQKYESAKDSHTIDQLRSAQELLTCALNNRAFILLNEDLPQSEQVKYDIIADLTKCIEINSEVYSASDVETISKQIYYNRARAYQLQHRYEEAINDYERFIKIHELNEHASVHLTAHAALSECYMVLGKFDAALPHVTLCIQELESQEINKKDRAFKIQKEQLSKSYTTRAVCHLSAHTPNIAQAIDDFSKAIEYNRKDIEMWINRALLYMFHSKDYEKAVFDFSVALLRFDGAHLANKTNSTHLPKLPLNKQDILYLRGQCYENVGKWQSALLDYSSIIDYLQKLPDEEVSSEHDRGSSTSMLQLLMNDQTLPLHHRQQEQHSLISGNSRKEMLSKLHTKMALLTLAEGKQLIIAKQEFDYSKFMQDALSALWKAVGYNANNVEALYHRSQIYIQLFSKMQELDESEKTNKFYDLAIADLSKIIKLCTGSDPDLARCSEYMDYALYNRAVLRFKKQEFESVADDLSKWLESVTKGVTADKRVRVLQFRAKAYYNMGKYGNWLKDMYASFIL